MSALPQQLIAILENATHNTQHAIDKANALDAANIPETSREPGPFKDVCKYLDDLITLTTSGSGLSLGGKITDQKAEETVYTSFKTFSKFQQDLFTVLIAKAGDVGAKVKASRLVTKLRQYEGTFDSFINQVADQCPAVAKDITAQHKSINVVLKRAIEAWALPASP